jgi:molybdate transport system substrate-binding protein
MHLRALTAVAIALIVVASGCGGNGDSSGSKDPQLTVFAATSLKKPLTAYGDSYDGAKVRYSFAGSDELAAQIRQGVKPDVFASANTKLPTALYGEGLVEKPVVFASNKLVLAVPAEGSKVNGLADLTRNGTAIAIGSESVPIGSYTRDVLGRLPAGQSAAILKNVRSNEPDVGGIVGKLTQGAVDAGFVYASDVRGAGGKLRALDLPASLQPQVAYGVAVVKGAKQPDAARKYIDQLVSGAGQDELRAAGFLPPPGN